MIQTEHRRFLMDTQDPDLKQIVYRPGEVDNKDVPAGQSMGIRERLSSATKAAGGYIFSASSCLSQAARDVKEIASTGSSKISMMASETYQGAIDTKSSLKDKAMGAGKAALAGAGVAVASKLAVKGLKTAAQTKGLEAIKPLGKGNVAANLVDATITVGREGYKLYRGESTKAEMAHACAEKGTGMIVTAGGAGLGAMAAAALALPTGGASLVVGGASMLAGYAAPKAYQAGRKLVSDFVDKRNSPATRAPGHEDDVQTSENENNNLKD